MGIREQYVLKRVEFYLDFCLKKQKRISPEILQELMSQWSFDYEANKEYGQGTDNEKGAKVDE